jgi:hypothetical protein
MNRDKSNRYQYQPWYIKLWRRRHYLSIPFVALRAHLSRPEDLHRPPFKIAWSIAIGLAQVKMNWLYDWSDLKERLEVRDKAKAEACQAALAKDDGDGDGQ